MTLAERIQHVKACVCKKMINVSALDTDWHTSKRIFDNDRYVYALTSLQLDEDADEEASPTFPLGTGTLRFKTVGAGGFGSIYVGTLRKRLQPIFQTDPFQLLGYYHGVLLAGHLSNKHTIAMLEEVDIPLEVAVKRVDPRKTDVVELIREASNLRVLWGRRNFVAVYGPTRSRDLDCLCVVTDYVRGCNLNDFLRSRGKDAFKHDRDVEEGARIMCRLLEADEVLWWMQKLMLFREIVIALTVCHSQNVYHGDLKGANILLDKTLVPKLVDFGLSFRRNDVSYLRSLGGSLFWAAPEVIDPPGADTIRESEIVSNPYPSDVYSLGMTLAEMVRDGNIPDSFTDEEFVLADKWSEGCPSYFLDHVPGNASGVDLSRLKKLIASCCCAERDDRTTLNQCLSEVNDIISEMFNSESYSPNRCSILYERVDHIFIGSSDYQNMVVRFKERFPGVPDCMIYSPSWNLVMDVEENLLVHYFCKLDYAEGVKYIVEKSKWGFQPERDIPYMALICVREESLQTLQYLGASWPDTMKRQLLLLHKACLCNNPEVFRFLLVDVGIDFDTWEGNQDMLYRDRDVEILRKPIHKLAARGKTEMVRMILENFEVDSSYVNTTIFRDTVENPIYYAMEGDHAETVRYLLERGAVIFDADEMYDRRAQVLPGISDAELHERKHAETYVVKILSAFETGNSDEVISLHFQIEFPSFLAEQCCKKGYLGILQFLEGCGLDLNLFRENTGDYLLYDRSLLHTAAYYWQVQVADYLIREWNYPMNSSFEPLFGSSPLQFAVNGSEIMELTQKIEMVKLLLKAGADPNYRDRGGYTAMDQVCGGPRKGARKLVELLLEAGFDCGQRDRWGEDYVDHIARMGAEAPPDLDYDSDEYAWLHEL